MEILNKKLKERDGSDFWKQTGSGSSVFETFANMSKMLVWTIS